MFFEGRAAELMIAAIVALIVVGPKDLPVLLRRLGQFMAKVRGMAAEFRASFDEMARQSELDDLRKEVEAMRKGQFADMAGSVSDDTNAALHDIHQSMTGPDPQPQMSYQYAAETPVEAPVVAKAPRKRKPAAATSATAKATPKAKPAAKAVTKAPAVKAPPKAIAKTAAAKPAAAKPRARKTSAS